QQHEHEPSWAAGPLGRGGRCDRELHADADGRVYACQLTVGHVSSTEPASSAASRPMADQSSVSLPWASRVRKRSRSRLASGNGTRRSSAVASTNPISYSRSRSCAYLSRDMSRQVHSWLVPHE